MRISSSTIHVQSVKMQTCACMDVWAIFTAIKKKNPHMMIALCGCMMQEPEVVEKIKEELPLCGS